MKIIQNIAFIWFKFEHTVCILFDSTDTRSQYIIYYVTFEQQSVTKVQMWLIDSTDSPAKHYYQLPKEGLCCLLPWLNKNERTEFQEYFPTFFKGALWGVGE